MAERNVSFQPILWTVVGGLLSGLVVLIILLHVIDRYGEFKDRAAAMRAAFVDLIKNAQDISKIESGRVELEESPLDLFQLLQEMQSSMAMRANEKGLEFTLEQSQDLPWHITVDGGRLRQVLINLAGLPADLLNELERALSRIDISAVSRTIEEIRTRPLLQMHWMLRRGTFNLAGFCG